MKSTKGFGFFLDKTLKVFQHSYVEEFKRNNIPLTIEQWAILERIHLSGGNTSQREITKTNYRNRATTSRIIRALINKSFVVKRHYKDDAKRFELEITDKGEKLINRVLPIVKVLREVSYKNIEEEEFDAFMRVLKKIEDNHLSIVNGAETN